MSGYGCVIEYWCKNGGGEIRMTLCFFVCCFSMACSTLRYHDNPPPVKGGREREGGERTHWWMRDMKAQPMNTIGHLSPSLVVCTCCCHGDGPSV